LRVENENLRARAAKAAGGEAAAPAQPAAGQARPGDPTFDAAVRAQAAQDRFVEDSQSILDAGQKDYPDFIESVNVVSALGGGSDEFVADLIAADKTGAHKMIHELAQDPAKVKRLVGMNSRARVAELARMAVAAAPAVPAGGAGKQVSRVPAPAQPLDGGAGSGDATDLGDNVPDDVWSKRFDKQFGLNGARPAQ
jgi:hypothetical protein